MLRYTVAATLVGLLVVAGTAQADFSAAIYMTSDLADPLHVLPGTAITITVWDAQMYGQNPWDNDISRIQLNWNDSSPALNLQTNSVWTWDAVTNALATTVDSNMSDGIVNRQGAGIGIAPPSPFRIGTLQFTAPAYVPGGNNTHVLALTGGSIEAESVSTIADGDNYLLEPRHGLGGGLTLLPYEITIVPEPATLALVGLGLAGLLARRRSK